MERIFEIDKNFKVMTFTGHTDAVFFDPRKPPFNIYGGFYENGMFRRMPEHIAKKVSEGVYFLHANTAGMRLRFRTDSPYILTNAKMSGVEQMHHFPLTGSAGFDLYVDNEYECSLMPDADMRRGYESTAQFDTPVMRDVTIHFPLYANVKELYIGIAKGAALLPGSKYRDIPPVVYYGSSITQGGCASRPGNAYQSIIARRLKADFINLGFSGSAKAEDEMISYVSSLEASAFVLDYDHNAPSVERLKNTHEKMFLALREKHPETPVLMLSRPKFRLTKDETERLETVRRTYENALERGDKNVRFIGGPELMKTAGNDGTVDNCHPNDLGFFSMAEAVFPVLREMLGR